MCGIIGFNWEEKELLWRMMKKVAHRGPDQQGHFISEGISLGHQRLSIVDISERGKQPIFNEQGNVCVILNGEIYNHADLRNDLFKHTFATHTDTEVIVHAYEEWNLSSISRLNGMFAFALYDAQRKQLVLARDRIGIKPLYYYWKNGKLIFASEIKAILEAASCALRKDSVGDILQYGFVPSPNTIWEGVYKLPPGHYALYKDGQFEVKKYWDMTFSEGHGDERYYALSFRAILKQCVKQQLMSDVPYGAYLSGGLDSSSIVASMASVVKNPVKTFSVGFDSKQVVDETKYAQLVAAHFGTDHHEVHVAADELLSVLPVLAYHLDEPIGNAAAVPLYYLSKEAKKKVTVVLTGNGGDELFDGYRQHLVVTKGAQLAKRFSFCKQNWVLAAAQKAGSVLPEKIGRYAHFFATYIPLAEQPSLAYAKLMYKTFPDESIKQLGLSHQPAHEQIAPFFSTQDTLVRQITKLDMKGILAEDYLMVDDKVNMIHAVESRVPYLDNQMVEFASNLPDTYKIHGLTGKYIVRTALKGILPRDVLTRKKYGFTPPVEQWSNAVLLRHCNELFQDKEICRALGVLSEKILLLLSSHDNERHNRVFPLVMLGEWAKQYLQ